MPLSAHALWPAMPRRPLVHLDGVPMQIVQRGHNREPCFSCDEDYNSYLHWPAEATGDAACAQHPYELITRRLMGGPLDL